MAVQILVGDALQELQKMPAESVHCVVTSPPYFGLRDYGVAGQIGLEETPVAYVARLVEVFREARRVLRGDGTLWLNLGDSYGWPKPKDLIGIPWRVAFALQDDGWYLRSDIIWSKPNPMPESVTDRCTSAHEYIFMLSKSRNYYFDADAIAENAIRAGEIVKNNNGKNSTMGKYGKTREGFLKKDGVIVKKTRNKRSVWNIPAKPYHGAHFAVMPAELTATCILAGCPEQGTVLDPFGGAGTTGIAASGNNREAILIELNPEYAAQARDRLGFFADAPLLDAVA